MIEYGQIWPKEAGGKGALSSGDNRCKTGSTAIYALFPTIPRIELMGGCQKISTHLRKIALKSLRR